MRKNIYSALLFSAIGVSFSVLAADGDIIVTSNFFVATCNLHTDSKSMTIPLNNVQLSTLKTAGATSDPVAFNLKFTDCAVGTFAWFKFEGEAAGGNNQVFALDDDGQSSTASGVGLEIVNDWLGEVVTINTTYNRLTTGRALNSLYGHHPDASRGGLFPDNVATNIYSAS